MSLRMLTQTNQPRGCLRKPNLVPIFRGQLCADKTHKYELQLQKIVFHLREPHLVVLSRLCPLQLPPYPQQPDHKKGKIIPKLPKSHFHKRSLLSWRLNSLFSNGRSRCTGGPQPAASNGQLVDLAENNHGLHGRQRIAYIPYICQTYTQIQI